MNTTIQIKRGLRANLPTLAVGEPAFCTDTGTLYIGSSLGNIVVAKLINIQSELDIMPIDGGTFFEEYVDFGSDGGTF